MRDAILVALIAPLALTACGSGGTSEDLGPCHYSHISAWALDTAALDVDGSVWYWGGPPRRAGDPLLWRRSRTTFFANTTGNAALMRRNSTACVWKQDGTIYCGGMTDIVLDASTRVVAQGRGYDNDTTPTDDWNCYVRGDGILSCWRNDGIGSCTGTTCTQGVCTFATDGTLSCQTCAKGADGTMSCSPSTRSLPGILAVDVPGGDVIAVGLGDAGASGPDGCAIRADHTLWCWGTGVLGDGTDEDDSNFRPPVEVPALHGIAEQVALGVLAKCVVTTEHALYCWGKFNAADLSMLEPVEMTALGKNVAKVDLGDWHACASMLDGRLFCFGQNDHGEVTGDDYGPGGTRDYLAPREVTALGADVVEFVTGDYHTCARKSDDSVWCWGTNATGQLGHPPVGSFVDFDPVPRQVIGCPAGGGQ